MTYYEVVINLGCSEYYIVDGKDVICFKPFYSRTDGQQVFVCRGEQALKDWNYLKKTCRKREFSCDFFLLLLNDWLHANLILEGGSHE
jgi:hypothetical protein